MLIPAYCSCGRFFLAVPLLLLAVRRRVSEKLRHLLLGSPGVARCQDTFQGLGPPDKLQDLVTFTPLSPPTRRRHRQRRHCRTEVYRKSQKLLVLLLSSSSNPQDPMPEKPANSLRNGKNKSPSVHLIRTAMQQQSI